MASLDAGASSSSLIASVVPSVYGKSSFFAMSTRSSTTRVYTHVFPISAQCQLIPMGSQPVAMNTVTNTEEPRTDTRSMFEGLSKKHNENVRMLKIKNSALRN